MSGGEVKVSRTEALGRITDRHVALVIGVTGIVGNHLAKHLLSGEGGPWQKVFGVSRKPLPEWMPRNPNYTHIQCDVENSDDVLANLGPLIGVTHLFWATWSRKSSELESCEANGTMFKNVLSTLVSHGAVLRHVALTTGTKHYLGPFELYGKLVPKQLPFKEDMERLEHPNFYYTLENIIFDFSKQHNFTWTVHRPFSIIGFAPGNLMNLGTSLAVYASICKETGEPFVFPGSPEQWEGRNDVSDANLVAEHEIWGATEPKAANEAYNVVNGDVFRWKELWPKLAAFYGLPEAPYSGKPEPLQERMKEKSNVWTEIVKKNHLLPYNLDDLAIWWHADADLSRPFEAFNDMSKSRERGFTKGYDTAKSFLTLFETLRNEKYTL